MKYFMTSMGTWALPLFILTVAILILTVKKVVDLYFRKDLSAAGLASGLHAIIFWGAVTAVTGLLGQMSGTYNAMLAISKAEAISPSIVATGLGESFTTTISGIIWFVLLHRYNRVVSTVNH